MNHPADFADIGEAFARETALAIILADGGGFIRFWNEGAAALFGHSSAEVAGQRVDLIVPSPYRDMHWAGFNRTIGSAWRGHESWGDIEALHKTGAIVPLQVLLTPLTGPDGGVRQVFAMFRRREG